jgi:hypothetical protein
VSSDILCHFETYKFNRVISINNFNRIVQEMNIMGRNSLISVLLALILLTCTLGVQAQGQNQMVSATSKVDVSQYSQYYSMLQGSAPKTHIVAPEKFDINGKEPTSIYFSYQQHAVPYSQYQTYATYTGGNSLWIQGAASWTQYVAVPQGSSLSFLAISSTGGDGYLYEIYPDGHLTKNNYYFYPGYNQINFYADSVGQHILLFVIDNEISNAVVINVVAYYPPVPLNPVPPTPKQQCEQNPTCNWVNCQCLCTGLIPDNPEKVKCEQNPTCNWVNGHCLCTGLNPPAPEPQPTPMPGPLPNPNPGPDNGAGGDNSDGLLGNNTGVLPN